MVLLVKTVSPIVGHTRLLVNANGQVIVSPIEVEVRPKPTDPETILREAKERMKQVADRFIMTSLEDTRKVAMAMNAAPSRNTVRKLCDAYSESSLSHYLGVLSLTIEDIWQRASADIVAAGGWPELVVDLNEFAAHSMRLVENFGDYLGAYTATASREFQQSPPLALVQARLPYEMDFRVQGPQGTPLNTTYVQLPSEVGVGTADTEVTGTMRLRFMASPNPEVAVITVLSSPLFGTPLVVGGVNFGPLLFSQDPNNPSTGTLNLRTGEILLTERYLVRSPLLQAIGLSPLSISFESKGVLYPISHFRLNVVTRGRPSSNSHIMDISGFLLFGAWTLPETVPIVSGERTLSVRYGCFRTQKPPAPRPEPLKSKIVGGTQPFWPPSKAWKLSLAEITFPFTLQVTGTPATNTTAYVGSVTATFIPAGVYSYGHTPIGARGLEADTPVGGAIKVHPEPVACVHMIISVEIVVKGDAYKTTRYMERLRIHFVR